MSKYLNKISLFKINKFLFFWIRKINKLPIYFLFFIYASASYGDLGSSYIMDLLREDGFFENMSFIFILFSSFMFFIKYQNKKLKKQLKNKKYLLFLSSITFFWALEEISYGQRIFQFYLPSLEKINLQQEANLHNIVSLDLLHSLYFIFCLFVSFLCILSNKYKSKFLPQFKNILFFLLPSLYYGLGLSIKLCILIFTPDIEWYKLIETNALWRFGEAYEFLLACGTFLYAYDFNEKLN